MTSPSPQTDSGPGRRLVFISHANPEENDFVRWLGVQRVYKTVDLFDQAIRKFLREEDSVPAVWFVVIPDDVHRFCRPKSIVPLPERTRTSQRFSARTARNFVQAPSMFAEDNAAAEPYR